MGIWVGRYAIVEGEVREHGPWLVDRVRASADGPVRLLVLAEPVDERSAEFCEEVAGAVAELFARETLSLTGGLLRALQQAHANLSEWNRRSLREHQIAIGVTCVAIRDGEATIARVGPGLVYIADAEGAERLTTAGDPAVQPLGGGEAVQPLFRSVPLEAGRQLLLLTSAAELARDPAAIMAALAAGPERALADLFVGTRNVRDVTAVLVAEVEGAADLPPAPVELTLREPLHAGRGLPDEPARDPSVDSGTGDDGAPGGAGGAGARGGARGGLPALRRPRVAGRDGTSRLPWRTVGLVAVVLLLVVLVVRFALPPLLAEDREARLTEALTAAAALLDDAALAGESAERRALLQSAVVELAQARSIAPEDARGLALDARAAAALAELDNVVEVTALRRVLEFQGALTAPVRPSALAAGGGALWLIDEAGGRLFRIEGIAGIDGASAVTVVEVYRSGERYGGAMAAAPLAMVWDGAAGRLLLLDAARTLFAFAPAVQPEDAAQPADGAQTGNGGPTVLQLRDVAEIASVQAIAAYAGNLYLLDARGGEVWRYLPAGDGYDSERGGLLGGLPLDGASALVVNGDLVLLDGDGALRRFRLGRELPPLLRGVDGPPQSPAGVAEDGAGGFYVADRGGRRIVVSDGAGEFVAQYRHAQFFDLRGVTFAPDGGNGASDELFVLTGDGIFVFTP